MNIVLKQLRQKNLLKQRRELKAFLMTGLTTSSKTQMLGVVDKMQLQEEDKQKLNANKEILTKLKIKLMV